MDTPEIQKCIDLKKSTGVLQCLKLQQILLTRKICQTKRGIAMLAMKYSHLKVKMKNKSNPTEPCALIHHTGIA